MTRKDKKAFERDAVQRLRAIWPSLSNGSLHDSERPDFLLQAGTELLGLEVTEYVRSSSRMGSPHRRGEALRQTCHAAFRSEFHKAHPYPVSMAIQWKPGPILGNLGITQRSVVREARKLAAFVVKHVPPMTGGVVNIDKAALRAEGLDLMLTGIGMPRNPGDSGTVDTWAELGIAELEVDELQRMIDEKNPLVPAYLKKCESVWLVIVVFHGTADVSRSAYLTGNFSNATYESSFEKVIVLSLTEPGSDAAVELQTAPIGC